MNAEQIAVLIAENKADARTVRLNAAFQTTRTLLEMVERQQQMIDYLLEMIANTAPDSRARKGTESGVRS